jgi:hypothetical protein
MGSDLHKHRGQVCCEPVHGPWPIGWRLCALTCGNKPSTTVDKFFVNLSMNPRALGERHPACVPPSALSGSVCADHASIGVIPRRIAIMSHTDLCMVWPSRSVTNLGVSPGPPSRTRRARYSYRPPPVWPARVPR